MPKSNDRMAQIRVLIRSVPSTLNRPLNVEGRLLTKT